MKSLFSLTSECTGIAKATDFFSLFAWPEANLN